MIKFAAIMTSAAIACSGASYQKNDNLADRLAALRCKRPVAITCPVQTERPVCPDFDIDVDAPAINPDETVVPEVTVTPEATVAPEETPAPEETETPCDPIIPTPTPAPTQAPEATLAPTATPAPTPDAGGNDIIVDSSISAYAQEVVRLVNIERANQGLSALTMDAALSAAAQVRAEEIDTTFSHTRPDGTSCFTVLKEFNISYRACGENIAKGSPTPARVVEGWMNSAGHRANILNENFTTIGVGVYEDAAGTMHWAQLFTA